MWSDAKHQGKPLRWYAERGQTVPRAPRAVVVESLQLWRAPGAREVGFRLVSNRGCSVRVLVNDLGAALGCGACLVSLRREAIGGFSVEKAWTLDVFVPMAKRFGKGFRGAPLVGGEGGGGGGGGGVGEEEEEEEEQRLLPPG